ncbi:SgcJ/EcaC family oxidoreductase [Saccharomonospora xinjiangensis]|uniref:DUF4440 domain-containing protein n=1 Tax=Saccharomonospora xinjiangensis XJ-54 TaxID=882086 RepID=I0UWZ5_9PSEU|nr:SgcJ/EcaC family oxidoreductase [Saccharomonospora xinjiangensis]EID52398.1 hypothetical protein SacxiDRAFT_0115 [Saccharomonospora xinjiangensis XJ-54]
MDTDSNQDIIELVERYGKAFDDGDADAMNALFTPDTVFVNVAGNLVRGADDLHRAQKSAFEGPLRGVRGAFTVENVALLGDDVAVVHVRQRNTWPSAEKTGGETRTASVIVFVLQRGPQGWRIRTGQNTPVAA